jgi:hypothetical protein
MLNVPAVVKSIIETTGRPVYFRSVVYSGCVLCSGSNPFCTNCNGTNQVEYEQVYEVIAAIKWKDGGERMYRSASHEFEGDARLTISYEPSIYDIIRSSKYVIVDNNNCFITKLFLGGIYNNRIYVVVKQQEENLRVG